MADLLRREDVRELIERAGGGVSVFLPAHRISQESGQDRIRLKNLLDEAEEQQVAGGLRRPAARAVLTPGRELLQAGRFWSYQSDGLALFLAPGWSRVFRLPLDLPELLVVADRFHVKPLLPLLADDQRFYVLALSQNEVRLLEGTRQSIDDVTLDHVPENLAAVLKYDDLEKELLLHIAGSHGPGRRGPAVFHGHGAGGEVDKVLLERFLRSVDEGLREILRDEHAPLVLAGVGYEQAMFREITRYRHVLEQGIEGNPETLSRAELHERARALVEPVFTQARQQAAQRYRDAAGRGHGAVCGTGEAVQAAFDGRVETLFVPAGQQQWGTVDPQTHEVTAHPGRRPGDEDLLDHAAVQTLITSGTVYVVAPEQVPGPGPVAALLRY
jgi:Bacterial archaeo-eukaryotic release factor family 3